MTTESVEDDYECLLLTFDWCRGVQGRNGMSGMDVRACLNSDRARSKGWTGPGPLGIVQHRVKVLTEQSIASGNAGRRKGGRDEFKVRAKSASGIADTQSEMATGLRAQLSSIIHCAQLSTTQPYKLYNQSNTSYPLTTQPSQLLLQWPWTSSDPRSLLSSRHSRSSFMHHA